MEDDGTLLLTCFQTDIMMIIDKLKLTHATKHVTVTSLCKIKTACP